MVGSPRERLPQSTPCLLGFAIDVCRHEMRLRLEDRGDYVQGRAASTRADDLVWRRVPGEGLVRDHEDAAPIAGAALVPCQLRRAQRGCSGLPPHVPDHRGERYEREECDAGN